MPTSDIAAKPNFLKLLLRWIWIPVTLAIIGGLALLINWDAVLVELRAADAYYTAAMLACWLLWLVARAQRLRLLVKAAVGERKISLNIAYGAHTVGLAANNILPMRAGELASIWLFRHRAGIPVGSGTSAIVLDRFCDLIGAVALLLLSITLLPSWPIEVAHSLPAFLVLCAIAVGGLVIVVMLRRHVLVLLERLLPAVIGSRLLPTIAQLLDGLTILADLRILLGVILWSAVVWGLAIVSIYFGVAAVWPGQSLLMATLLLSCLALAFLLPAAPGGIGLYHAASIFCLALFAVPAETAMAFALLTHTLTLLSSIVVALLWIAANGVKLRIMTGRG